MKLSEVQQIVKKHYKSARYWGHYATGMFWGIQGGYVKYGDDGSLVARNTRTGKEKVLK